MLELRPNCQMCDKDLPPNSLEARICSHECTFCADCVDNRLFNVCPNCGGGLVPRPIRPATEWRPSAHLAANPPSTTRRKLKWTEAEVSELVTRLRDVAPVER